MNKTDFVSTLFISIFLFCATFIYAQNTYYGSPLALNYKPADFQSFPMNTAIAQNKQGVMFFGNKGHILSFDGRNWKKIPFRQGIQVNCIQIDSLGTLYASGNNQFGYYFPNEYGELEYHSLSDPLKIEKFEDEYTSQIFLHEQHIYFQNLKNIVRFKITDPKYFTLNKYYSGINRFVKSKEWSTKSAFLNSFLVDSRKFFVIKKDVGLMQLLDNSELKLIKGGNRFVNDGYEIVNILPYGKHNNMLLIFTKRKGIFKYIHKHGLANFRVEEKGYFDQDEILQAVSLSDNKFLLCTQRQGIIIINESGKIIEKFAKNPNLPVEKILSVYYNKKSPNLLWLTTNYGISKLMLKSPVRKLTEASQIQGIVFDVKTHEDTLYARTSSDMYALKKEGAQGYRFSKIPDIVSPRCWLSHYVKFMDEDSLGYITENHLITGSIDGIYDLYQSIPKKIYNLQHVNVLYQSQFAPSLILSGHKNGLSVIAHQHGKWIPAQKIDGINSEITSIYETNRGIWTSDTEGRLFLIEFSYDSLQTKEIKINKKTFEIPALPDSMKVKRMKFLNEHARLQKNGILKIPPLTKNYDSLVFITNKGLFRLNSLIDEFVTDEDIISSLQAGNKDIRQIIFAKNGDCWTRNAYISGQINISFFRKNKLGLFSPYDKLLNYIPPMTVENIVKDEANNIWFCGNEGLYNFNTNFAIEPSGSFKALITHMSYGHDSIIYAGQNYVSGRLHDGQKLHQFMPPKLPTNLNDLARTAQIIKEAGLIFDLERKSVLFQYAAPFFEYESGIMYSYKLEKYDRDWSEYSTKNEKEYTFLPEGKYTFYVKAKNIYGHESSPAKFSFEILPAWYNELWVKITAGVILLLIILYFFRVYFRRLRRKNEQLEKQVAARTSEIVKQKEEIELKNTQLEKQQTDIIEKNNELESTLAQLTDTQKQLVQQEKLASLGQLTAGVAHEIKNPLNFAHNFSKLSLELINEDLQETIQKEKNNISSDSLDDLEYVKTTLSENLHSIIEETDRANQIIQDMLQHSRGTSGKFSATEFNRLVNEYVTLAYKSVKGQDSEASIELHTQFDKSIQDVVVSPQDLSRLIINLINNACYAVIKKKEKIGSTYIPKVTVSTKKLPNKVQLCVKDNGTGISKDIRDKIFNPFFTTKPIGQGTGLGLSLSYDVINQLHKGSMTVNSEEGEYTEFIIEIPDNLQESEKEENL